MARIILSVLGWLNIALAAMGVIAAFSKGPDGMDIGMITFFLIIGICLLYASKKIGKSQAEEPIQEQTTISQVVTQSSELTDPIKQNEGGRQVQCSSCGASVNITPSSNGKCEYCGSSISF